MRTDSIKNKEENINNNNNNSCKDIVIAKQVSDDFEKRAA
jgi:hypothetical protein